MLTTAASMWRVPCGASSTAGSRRSIKAIPSWTVSIVSLAGGGCGLVMSDSLYCCLTAPETLGKESWEGYQQSTGHTHTFLGEEGTMLWGIEVRPVLATARRVSERRDWRYICIVFMLFMLFMYCCIVVYVNVYGQGTGEPAPHGKIFEFLPPEWLAETLVEGYKRDGYHHVQLSVPPGWPSTEQQCEVPGIQTKYLHCLMTAVIGGIMAQAKTDEKYYLHDQQKEKRPNVAGLPMSEGVGVVNACAGHLRPQIDLSIEEMAFVYDMCGGRTLEQDIIWPSVCGQGYRGQSLIDERVFYATKGAAQGGHEDRSNYDEDGKPLRRSPAAFILTPLSEGQRKLDLFLVKYRDGGEWQAVPWDVAEKVGGVAVREGARRIVPCDPRTYTVSGGWRVEYHEIVMNRGECVVCDGSTYHGGHVTNIVKYALHCMVGGSEPRPM